MRIPRLSRADGERLDMGSIFFRTVLKIGATAQTIMLPAVPISTPPSPKSRSEARESLPPPRGNAKKSLRIRRDFQMRIGRFNYSKSAGAPFRKFPRHSPNFPIIPPRPPFSKPSLPPFLPIMPNPPFPPCAPRVSRAFSAISCILAISSSLGNAMPFERR